MNFCFHAGLKHRFDRVKCIKSITRNENNGTGIQNNDEEMDIDISLPTFSRANQGRPVMLRGIIRLNKLSRKIRFESLLSDFLIDWRSEANQIYQFHLITKVELNDRPGISEQHVIIMLYNYLLEE